MATHDMFLAMILANAKREESSGIILTVENSKARIDLLLLDGSSRPLTPPPPEILVKIIDRLEDGETSFSSSVFAAQIETVTVKRGPSSIQASISAWTIEHT
jgi:hypothetical protein